MGEVADDLPVQRGHHVTEHEWLRHVSSSSSFAPLPSRHVSMVLRDERFQQRRNPSRDGFLLTTGGAASERSVARTSQECATQSATLLAMATITHRELRNNSAEVLRRVAAGEAMEVTNRGVVVAYLSPTATPAPPFPVSRPARRSGGWSALPKVALNRPANEIVDDEREDRW